MDIIYLSNDNHLFPFHQSLNTIILLLFSGFDCFRYLTIVNNEVFVSGLVLFCFTVIGSFYLAYKKMFSILLHISVHHSVLFTFSGCNRLLYIFIPYHLFLSWEISRSCLQISMNSVLMISVLLVLYTEVSLEYMTKLQ